MKNIEYIKYDDYQSVMRIYAMYGRRINELTKITERAMRAMRRGNIAVVISVILYLLIGALFDLPDKIGGIIYGFVLPIVITILCYLIPNLFVIKERKKTTLTGVRGIRIVK